MIRLVTGGPADAGRLAHVYFRAVHEGAAPHYTEAQRAAWAPPDDPAPWLPDRLAAGRIWIAEEAGTALGFLAAAGAYMDLFFVLPEARRGPVAPMLYDAFLASSEAPRLTTHASALARRFLERRGWQVTAHERTERHGQTLDRWAMALDRMALS